MATSPSDIVDAIDAAILTMMSGGGAQTLSVGGKTITYTDLDSLRKARAYYQTLASTAASTTGGIKTCLVTLKGEN